VVAAALLFRAVEGVGYDVGSGPHEAPRSSRVSNDPVPSPRRYRILALDVDGTLLDPDGVLRPATAQAVARAATAGIQPVVCTGRRYRRARPIALELGLHVPIVCNSGARVKDPADHRTLWGATLRPDAVAAVMRVFDSAGYPAISFTDLPPDAPDFHVAAYPTGRPLYDDYLGRNLEHAAIDPNWYDRRPAGAGHFHLCAIGSRPEMLEVENRVLAAAPGLVRTFVQRSPRYAGTMCEVLDPSASKWSAVLHLAELWRIDPTEIVAVGDDRNDVPMIAGAGLGVAMGHAPPEVLEVADHITLDHEHDGVARLVDEVLLA
jgi:hydroxymethylpyrimidine pyrophosphatase-like HAD family hydrolase